MAEQSEWRQRWYPEAEYRKRAVTTCEVLEEELGFYPDGPSFRGGLVAIGRIYEKTKLMQCFVKYAHLAVIASVAQGKSEGLNGMAPNFLAGETLAIHSLLKPADLFERRRFLSQDLFSAIGRDTNNELLEQAVEELAEYRATTWRDVLDFQTPRHQELLMEAAMRTYDDVPNAGNAEDDFMAGYLYAGSLLVRLDETM